MAIPTEFSSFKKHLHKTFQHDLPGLDAQRILAPRIELPNDRLRPDHNDYRLGGVLALFYPVGSETHLVFIQRHEYDGAHSGQISFPGGRYENQDASIQETALRETEEEVGVNREKVQVVGRLSELYIPPSNYLVKPFVGVTDFQPDFKREEKEVKEILEVPVSRFFEDEKLKTREMKLSMGKTTDVPYFDIDDRVLWGATAMMMSELLVALGWKPANV